MFAFAIWALLGCSFVGLGVYNMKSKKEVASGFWANAETFPVADIRAYNRAVGKLFCVFGIIFILLGTPLLDALNTPFILLSVLGVMVEAIGLMVIYVIKIEKKYRKK